MNMKRIIIIVALIFSGLTAFAQSYFTVGQYNMRYDSSKDRENGYGWELRSKSIIDMVNFEGWDIIGAQELLHNQMLDLKNGLDGYDYIGVGRNDGQTKGEYAAIFYKTSRMKCLENGQFWLSETPEVPGSKGWDTSQCRI
jgi:endonuclease/exonuclease/phosphatase family metal-dependent hydrolase